jgi:hypothetical protein
VVAWPQETVDAALCDGPLEAAHIIGRDRDGVPPLVLGQRDFWKPNLVVPNRIVPLCRKHHRAYDAHELDLLGYLTAEEEAQAVLDAGSIESARRRLCPSEYRRTRAEKWKEKALVDYTTVKPGDVDAA